MSPVRTYSSQADSDDDSEEGDSDPNDIRIELFNTIPEPIPHSVTYQRVTITQPGYDAITGMYLLMYIMYTIVIIIIIIIIIIFIQSIQKHNIPSIHKMYYYYYYVT